LGDAAPANNALVIHNISYDSHADPELAARTVSHTALCVYYKKKRVSFASIIKHDINNGLRTLFLSFGFVCDVFVGALSLSLSARVIAQPAAAESKQISLLDMREL
jgi:hypothetical protein